MACTILAPLGGRPRTIVPLSTRSFISTMHAVFQRTQSGRQVASLWFVGAAESPSGTSVSAEEEQRSFGSTCASRGGSGRVASSLKEEGSRLVCPAASVSPIGGKVAAHVMAPVNGSHLNDHLSVIS